MTVATPVCSELGLHAFLYTHSSIHVLVVLSSPHLLFPFHSFTRVPPSSPATARDATHLSDDDDALELLHHTPFIHDDTTPSLTDHLLRCKRCGIVLPHDSFVPQQETQDDHYHHSSLPGSFSHSRLATGQYSRLPPSESLLSSRDPCGGVSGGRLQLRLSS